VHQQFVKYFFAKISLQFHSWSLSVTFSSSRPAWVISFVTITVPTDQQPASQPASQRRWRNRANKTAATTAADQYEP
jgi:hypothetical protein